MFNKILTFVFVLYVLYEPSDSLRCRRSVEDDKKRQSDLQIPSECTGDLCVTNIITSTTGGQVIPLTSYGCLTGFDMKIGCSMDSWNNTVCVCNDKDMCNKNVDADTAKSTKTEVECYSGEIKDGKLVGSATCKGQQCQISYTPNLSNAPSQMAAGCVYDLIPTFMTGSGCLLYPNAQSGNDTWQCRCQTNLCNSPTSFTIPKRTGSVKCGTGFFTVNSTNAPVRNRQNEHSGRTEQSEQSGGNQQSEQTCTGDFCLLTPMGDPPVLYSKQCMSVSNGAHVSSKKFKFDLGKSTADMYVCDMDMCNTDVDTAMKHIGMSGSKTGKIEMGHTGENGEREVGRMEMEKVEPGSNGENGNATNTDNTEIVGKMEMRRKGANGNASETEVIGEMEMKGENITSTETGAGNNTEMEPTNESRSNTSSSNETTSLETDHGNATSANETSKETSSVNNTESGNATSSDVAAPPKGGDNSNITSLNATTQPTVNETTPQVELNGTKSESKSNNTSVKHKDDTNTTSKNPKDKGAGGGASTLVTSSIMVLTISFVITRL